MKSKAISYLNGLVNDETTKKEIDLLDFIKKCVREFKSPEELPKVEWQKYFETLWKIYPRKVEKQNAKKMFERKIRGLNEQECKDKCNLIYKAEMRYISQIKERETPVEYIKHFASWLNAEVPNSKHYKGR